MTVTIDGTTGISAPGVTDTGNLSVTGTSAFTGSVGNITAGTVTASTGVLYPIVNGTAVASTSGTSITFSSIPSWVKCIKVMFNGVSTSGTSQVRIRIGPSGGVETSGYLGTCQTALITAVNTQNFTAGFDLYDGGAAAAVRNGMFILSLLDSATNTWTAMANIGQSNEARSIVLGGVKPLAGVLSVLSVTTVNGTDTFDAGSINIQYE